MESIPVSGNVPTMLLKTLLEPFDYLEHEVKTLKENEARQSASSTSEAETSTRRNGGDGTHTAPVTPEGTRSRLKNATARRPATAAVQGAPTFVDGGSVPYLHRVESQGQQ